MKLEIIEQMREQLLSFMKQKRGKIQIVDKPIPPQLQFEYALDYMRLSPTVQHMAQEDLEVFVNKALRKLNYSSDMTEKRDLLTVLSSVKLPRVHTALKDYIDYGDRSLRQWATMACMGCRLNLIEDFTESNMIFVASGLGGDGDMIRFNLVLLSCLDCPFSEFERGMIDKECKYHLSRFNGRLDDLEIAKQYARLVFLLPVAESPSRFVNDLLATINEFRPLVFCPDTISSEDYFSQEKCLELVEQCKQLRPV